MRTHLDWSAYESYGQGDAYAHIPATGGDYAKATAVCIGARQCQGTAPKGLMCPSFRATMDVAHSTQARAAALRAALDGEYGPDPFMAPQVAEAMDLCVGCKGCKRECPNGVDMAALRTEALAQRREHEPASARDQWFANFPDMAAKARRLGPLPGLALTLREKLPAVAAFIESRYGISARRPLPRLAPTAFLDRSPSVYAPAVAPVAPDAAATPAAAPTLREVVLLVDSFTNQLDPSTADAAVKLLTKAGYVVHIARALDGGAPLCCGRTAHSGGFIERAKEHATRMLDALEPMVERGLPVLGLEPSCLVMLRDEYQQMGFGARAQKVAKSAWLLEEFLAREHDGKRLKIPFRADLPERNAVVHGHCHQKAFGAMKAMRKVLGLVPNLKVEFIESSCCGMAGSFGYEAEHYEVSMKMGELALLPAVRACDAATEVIANGTSCRSQIADGAKREARHFVHTLAAALD
ncbi:(Fe-S)-binding protein [Derxia gummosa]|uniref:(Fe-S)-binding protein n=1 Tax=Derxia gummosa DSM 723 TaxID=1121388 RepID=A0A8B6X8P5_9BURK|nr:4Fe-4S dicluster domain-containing protein [Derxia gummosa]